MIKIEIPEITKFFKNLGKFLKKTTPKLIVPAFIWIIFLYLLPKCLNTIEGSSSFLKLIGLVITVVFLFALYWRASHSHKIQEITKLIYRRNKRIKTVITRFKFIK